MVLSLRTALGASLAVLSSWVAFGAAAVPAGCGSAPPPDNLRSSATGVLPADVTAALARAQVPPEAMTAVVFELSQPCRQASRLAWRADAPVNPASLMKLVTGVAALDLLGPAWQWRTPVWLDGTVSADGVLHGNLVIRGSGDPTLVLERLWLLLRRVQRQGVRHIDGDIVLDRSAFAVPERGAADFDGEPLRPYNVQPDALLLNYQSIALSLTPEAARGAVSVSYEPSLAGLGIDSRVVLTDGPCGDWQTALRLDTADPSMWHLGGRYALACGANTWQVGAPDPLRYSRQLIGALWAETGGSVSGSIRAGRAPDGAPRFEWSSPPLAEVLRDINKYSNNVMAQQLFLTLGRGEGAAAATPESARHVLGDWLALRFGAAGRAALIDNGSGLSRDNRLSARLLVDLLQFAWFGPTMPELLASLPVPGLDGTLRRNRQAGARAHLKTGSLRDVVGIAGIVLGDSGRRHILVAVVNHPQANAARPALDALLRWTAADLPTKPRPSAADDAPR